MRHPIHSPIKIEMDTRPSPQLSRICDISLGGLSFLWSDPIDKATILRISIPVKEHVFELQGKVVHVEKEGHDDSFRIGIAFVQTTDAFIAKMAEETLEIIEYRKRISRESGFQITEEEAATRWIKKYADTFTKLHS